MCVCVCVQMWCVCVCSDIYVLREGGRRLYGQYIVLYVNFMCLCKQQTKSHREENGERERKRERERDRERAHERERARERVKQKGSLCV